MSNSESKKYVVVRDGIRVSDTEYTTESDAKPEFDHWKKIKERWPDSTVLEVVEKDEKKHRIV